ncbi:hypothetical protein SAMN03097699_0775 [Flavobacteriaceae bacterium MAR_2010_188]|nr:hypothetical protein SAMN03097699_0775 [Flavobacteriaceae bacterium MAR_2010_188]
MKQPIDILKQMAKDSLRLKNPNVPIYALPKTPKYTQITSNGLTKCVIDFLSFEGHQAERISTTGRFIDNTKQVVDVLGRSRTIGSKQWIKSNTTNGSSDISATIYGRSVKIEVKCAATGDHYQSKDQKAYQRSIEQAGGIYVIARTFDGFYEWYLQFKRGLDE